MAEALRQRVKPELPEADAGAGFTAKPASSGHPNHQVKHSKLKQYMLMVALSVFFLVAIILYISQRLHA